LCEIPFQYFDTVGWATGMASGLYKAGCRFVGGDYLTGALHCGKAHVQSQWEKASFDPNDIKIPEIFQI